MKNIFVVNPISGIANGPALVNEAIKKHGIKGEVYQTTAPRDASRFVLETIKNNPGTELRFIACGGDGTINEVFSAAAGHEKVTVSIFPCGGGNDFVKVYGGTKTFSNLKALTQAETRSLDAIRGNGHLCINAINFGFDAAVVASVERSRKKRGRSRRNAYIWGVIKAFFTSRHNRFTVTVDGEVLNPDGKGLLCAIANGQYAGGYFKCAPASLPDDGVFDVCFIKPVSAFRFLSLAMEYTRGNHLKNPKFNGIMEYRKGRTVHVSAPEGFFYSLDGELTYENELTYEIVPGMINIAVPKMR